MRSMSQDTKYRDSGTGETATLGGSKWREDGVNLRLDKDLNENKVLNSLIPIKQVRMAIQFQRLVVNTGI